MQGLQVLSHLAALRKLRMDVCMVDLGRSSFIQTGLSSVVYLDDEVHVTQVLVTGGGGVGTDYQGACGGELGEIGTR